MNDVNSSILSNNAELASQIFTIASLADLGYKASFSDNPDSQVDSDTLGILFQVIKEKLDTLLVSVEKDM